MIESTEKFWETVYRRNIGKMVGICYRYTANQQLSEDLAHDAFLKAIDKSASFEGKGCFDAWLRRIVVNHVLQYMRDQKKKKYFDDWMQQESSVVHIADTTSNAHPIGQVDFSEKELLDAINDLPEHHRHVFNLYVMENFTHAQIGEELGISAGTSKSHLARARKKIKQLLTEKGKKKRDEKDRKRVLPLFFFPYKPGNIDRLYRQQFNNFEIPPKKVISLEAIDFSRAPVSVVKPRAVTSWNYILAIASIGIISTVVFFVFNALPWQNSIITTEAELVQSTVHNKDKDLKLVEKSSEELKGPETKEKAKTIEVLENNSLVADSNTATIFPDSIILNKNIKNKSMKNLDSLAIMFLVSSGIIFDSVAQPDYKKDFPGNIENQVLAVKSQPMKAIEVIKTEKPNVKSKEENGTIYASRLFWSGENNEVYLKGKVGIEFGDNNFKGNGSFNFLGPVYLLIFNDRPATLNATIELSNQPYHLTRLDSKEATKKYGEKGRQGAVEISVID